MKGTTIAGIILIALGILALAYQGITYTRQKNVVDLGPIQATTQERHTIALPPIIGGVAIVVGVILVVAGARTTRS